MAKVKVIYHFSAWKRVLEDTYKENDCVCVMRFFRLSFRTRLSCVAGAGFFSAKEVISRTRDGKKGEEIPSTLRVFLSRGVQARTRYHSESKVG